MGSIANVKCLDLTPISYALLIAFDPAYQRPTERQHVGNQIENRACKTETTLFLA